MRRPPPTRVKHLWVGQAALVLLALVVVGTGWLRSRVLVSSDNAVTVHVAERQSSASTVVAPTASGRSALPALETDVGAELAKVRAELDVFRAQSWPNRVPGCQSRQSSHLSRLEDATLRAVNETYALERQHPRWLSRELLSARAKDGIVIVTWANSHFSDFVRNFGRSLQRLGLDNYLVGALDDELVQVLARSGDVPTTHVFRMLADAALEEGAQAHWGWGSANFNQMGRHKGVLMRSALALRVTLLLCDVDTVWLRDPMPFFHKYPEADLLITSDLLEPSRLSAETADSPWAAADGGLEAPTVDVGHMPHSQLLLVRQNIGVMLLRPSAAMRLFIEEYNRELGSSGKGVWDQSLFNDILRLGYSLASSRLLWQPKGPGQRMHQTALELRGVTVPRTHADRTVDLHCGALRVGVLPVPTFAHGHGFFVSRLHERLGQRPFVVHNTYQYAGASGKRMRFREAGLWFADPPTRFALNRSAASRDGLGAAWATAHPAVVGAYPARALASGGGLLRAAVFLPASALARVDVFEPAHNASLLPLLHARLVQAQLAGAADAFALARALRRVFELPALWCSCDRTFMVAWNCSYWPVQLQRPFRCPVDHAYSLGAWDELRLPYREPGFWDRQDRGAQAQSARQPSTEARVHVCGARASAAQPSSPSLALLARTVDEAEAEAGAAGEGQRSAFERELARALAARCRRAQASARTPPSSLVTAFRAANEEGAQALAAGGYGGSSAAVLAARAALLPRGLSDEAIAEALAPFAHVPSLALDSTDGVFGGFALPENRRSFKEHFEGRLGMDWCCTPTGGFRFNFTAGANCQPERVAVVTRGHHDRILNCEGEAQATVAA